MVRVSLVRAHVVAVALLAVACSRNSDEIDGPAPTLAAFSPDLVCVEQSDQEVVLSGAGLAPLVIDSAKGEAQVLLPEVFLQLTADLAGTPVGGASEVAVPADRIEWESQQALRISLETELGLEPGVYDVRVVNGSGQETVLEDALTVVPSPTVSAAEPDLFCGEQEAAEIELHGSGFLQVGDELPTVTIGEAVYDADTVDDCTPLDASVLDAMTCNELVFTIPAGALDSGWHTLSVRNPAPADCEHSEAAQLYLVDAPVISDVNTTEVCDQDANDFTIEGSGFLDLDGVLPTVTIEGVAATVQEMSGCVTVDGYPTASLCTSIRATVPDGSIELGSYTVIVTNPGEFTCSATADGYIGPPPIVTGTDPLAICPSGGIITVTGEGFWDGAIVTLTNDAHTEQLETTFVDEHTLTAVVPATVPPGFYDVIVTNHDGCESAQVAVLEVTEMPVVFFVDPYTLYSGANIQVTIYTTGILGEVTDVSIYPDGDPGSATSVVFTADSNERLQAIIPEALTAGAYGVTVTDDMGCTASLSPAFQVVSETTVALDRIELPFGWTSARTGVDIYSPSTLEVGEVNFAPIPRFYLSPTDAGADTTASELKSVAYVSPLRATAVVPEGLAVGTYNLIAVNPDGAVGFLADAFEVTADPPPEVHTISPASIVNQGVHQVTIEGESFRTPTLEVICEEPDAGTPELLGTIVDSSDSTIVVSFDFENQTIDDGAVCTIKVINDDGTYDVYSALGITNPSLNLEPLAPATTMVTARRAPCAVAGEAVPAARFVYAIGGDDGNTRDTDATTVYASVEMAPIDSYGDLGTWVELPYALPSPRSFHSCATIGRFVFVAGGNAGTGGQDEGTSDGVWRAKILDPEESPQITDVALTVDQDQPATLAAGRYSYRVSAVMPAGHAENPNGETLASEPQLVQTPDISALVSITIEWSPVAGAAAYRIYRTAAPGDASGTELLLAQVASTSTYFVDDGTTSPSGASPLPLGALGQFAVLPSMNTPREGAGIAVAANPVEPSIHHLYMLGGRDDGGALLASIEWLDVTANVDGTQTIGAAWTAGSADIGPARWQLSAFAADKVSAPDLITDSATWIYAGGGLAADLQTMVPDVVALKVGDTGALGEGVDERYAVESMNPFQAGYVAVLCANQLFAFGGNHANSTTESFSAELCGVRPGACDTGGGTPIPDPPELANWNNLGIDLSIPRYLAAGVTISAYIVVLGGIDDSTPAEPLDEVGQTLW